MKGKNYRKGVGIIIVNAKGQFFLGKRIGAEAWQFPQGGIDEGENPEEALYRELHEETGLIKDRVTIVTVSKRWLVYHIPHVYQRSNKQYDGAMQKWFLLRLTGTNEDINLNAVDQAEFDAWKWADKKTAINSVIRFKKGVYASIFSEFSDVLKGLKNN
ncbi:RNA pyrophosphohydrolase [Gammaproteobacteria bacterium]|jgi:putative (di)nucleoside polyphosphate hydrolase|nr:RNA pyrophosphohydrolase [Gammaproteobacteria bacterium]|tara:strand:+ start:544 stop:1020 length:477 start_codon:yes stop_codon:yes gene_type:complete